MSATVVDLAFLPDDSHIFVDTNILYLHYESRSVTCTAFVDRIAKGEVTAYVNAQVLSDLLHKLMLAEALRKKLVPKARAIELKDCLKADRTHASALVDCQLQLENTIIMGVKVLPINRRVLLKSKTERQLYGLMAGDSLHLGTMNYRPTPILDIATHDGDFAHISGLTVWKPMDVIARLPKTKTSSPATS